MRHCKFSHSKHQQDKPLPSCQWMEFQGNITSSLQKLLTLLYILQSNITSSFSTYIKILTCLIVFLFFPSYYKYDQTQNLILYTGNSVFSNCSHNHNENTSPNTKLKACKPFTHSKCLMTLHTIPKRNQC